MSRGAVATVVIAAWTMSLAAQREPQTNGPSFEVASIKRTVPAERQRTGFPPSPTRFTAIDVPAAALIGFAYRGTMDEIRGAPEWSQKEHYDVEAPVMPGTTPDQRALMLRNLLVERFHLAYHFVTEEHDALALVRTRPDAPTPKGLRAVVADCDAIAAAGPRPLPSSERDEMPPCSGFDAGRMIRSGGLPIKYLADRIRLSAGRLLVDDTGLTGNFAFTLKYSPNRPGWPEPNDEYPELATALRDQLELKLVPKKIKASVLVVDRFDRPTED